MVKELRLALLGRLRITRDGVPVKGFVSNKAQALLCYLAVTCRTHLREPLAGLLWGVMPDSNARANLRMALSNLRKLVGPHLIITRETAAFNRGSPYWLDVETFQEELRELRETEGIHPLSSFSSSSSLRSLQTAVELYQGDFLEGFHVRGAPAFEDWVLGQQEQLRQLALQALYALAAYHTARGVHAAAMDYTTRLLALEPWQEEAHRQLMLLLALTGRRSEALEQYARCRRLLARGLGVEPLEETTALYRRIRDGEESPHLPIPPSPMLPFVGREEEHAQLVAAWEQARGSQGKLTLIEGEAGMGKTRLAEEVLRYTEAQGAMVLRGRCYEFGATVAYQPIAEALRCLSRGAEVQGSGGARETPSHSISSAPPPFRTLPPVWLAEVARLPARSRDLLRLAAVIGREFELPLLRMAAGEDAQAVDESVGNWLARGFVKMEGGRGKGEKGKKWKRENASFAFSSSSGYDFAHDMIRAVVYQAAGQTRQRVLHRRVGEALEGLHAGRLEPVYEQLAYHFEQAGAVDKAVTYLPLARAKAAAVYANHEALDYYARALALLAEGDERRWEVLLRRAEILRLVGEYEEAVAACRQVVEGKGSGPAVWQARAANQLSVLYRARRDYEAARAWAQAAYRLATAAEEKTETGSGRSPTGPEEAWSGNRSSQRWGRGQETGPSEDSLRSGQPPRSGQSPTEPEEARSGDRPPQLSAREQARAKQVLGEVEREQGNLDLAQRLFEARARAVCMPVRGHGSPGTGLSHISYPLIPLFHYAGVEALAGRGGARTRLQAPLQP